MARSENSIKEAIAVFAWFVAAFSLVFIAGLLILEPWAYITRPAYVGVPLKKVDVSTPYEVPIIYETFIIESEAEVNMLFRRGEIEYANETYVDYETSPFMAYSFFIPENEAAYAKFYAKRPDLDAETVVWMVNVHLHLPFFYKVFVNYDPYPLLVNPFYRLPAGFVPQNLEPLSHDNCVFLATAETVAAYRRMLASAREDGFNFWIASAYRTAGRQQEIFLARGSRDGFVMRPYHSEHQTGRALDLRVVEGLLDRRGPTATGDWVRQNAHLYGFITRYRAETIHITGIVSEPWHVTYVGREIATYMFENNILSLEEFVGRNPGIGLR